ncbi:ferrochelatase [Nitrospina watsonii]|uniref:Ferrochelatase n=1 Tax=Nitrospina watsonii TaxID=1323948 RepID=A0ABN8W6X3_9BACT|nr:ferrochelatase [Nitrospina watsonii]CAI2719396.1 Ferrochelatase [Nitrospina watsonii]
MDDAITQGVKTGVILLAHGAPTRVADIPEYLQRIRGGTASSTEVIREITERYEAIGGSSPLLEITQGQAEALERFLNQGEDTFRVYIGMRNWYPLIEEAVQQAKDDGMDRLIALCLAPQFSKWSTERYLNSFNEALGKCNAGDIPVQFIKSWPNQPSLIDAFAERYRAAESDLKAKGHDTFHTVFTVHSIPSAYVEEGIDPYVQEYEKTLNGIRQQVPMEPWHQAYQSQGMIPCPWLEPSVEETLDNIAEEGGKAVLIFPVGFVCDHIEILYDIDIGFREYAEQKGLTLFRTESLNTSPLFIEALAGAVWEHLA